MDELLNRREQIKAANQKAYQNLEKLQGEQKKLQDKGKADKAEALTPKIAEAQEYFTTMTSRMNNCTKGIINRAARINAQSRYDHLKQVFGQYAVLSATSAERKARLWRGLLDRLDLDATEMESRAKLTLQGLPSSATSESVTAAAGGGGPRSPTGVDAPVDL